MSMINKIVCFFIIMITLCFLGNYSYAKSAWKIEQYNYFSGGHKPTITLYAVHPIDKEYSITGFFLVNDSWGEGYLGLNYKVYDWLAVEFELGIETYTKFLRWSPSFSIDYDKYSLYGVFENGGSVTWYNLRGAYKYDYYYIGAMIARFYGYGPRVDYQFKDIGLNVWGAGLYDWGTEMYGAMIGASMIFD